MKTMKIGKIPSEKKNKLDAVLRKTRKLVGAAGSLLAGVEWCLFGILVCLRWE
ncbi:MAG TPA: hypothetical protein VK536_05935 [Candidatus Limnocylindrales bacterium]|nr:hypothetical protein [Candidatus Limnocylindrales bacterium]